MQISLELIFETSRDWYEPTSNSIGSKRRPRNSSPSVCKNLDNEFPMVLKTLQGAKGVGVLLVETERSLQSTVSLVYKIDPTCDILLQEYKDMEYDVRVMINNKKIIGAMRRNKIIDDFRSNISQGADAEEIELTEIEKETCLQLLKQLVVSGLELILSQQRTGRKMNRLC